MLSRRTLRRLRHMRARKDRYQEQHDDSDEEAFINLLPGMLDELEEERRESKVFSVDEDTLVRSRDEIEDSTEDKNSQPSLIGMLRTPAEVFVKLGQCDKNQIKHCMDKKIACMLCVLAKTAKYVCEEMLVEQSRHRSLDVDVINYTGCN